MHSKINSMVAGFDCRRSSLIFFLLLSATGFLLPSLALAVPVATTQVAKICEVQAGGDYELDQTVNVAQPFEQATACNIYAVGTLPYTNEAASANAEGYVSAGFGPGISQIGITSTSAQVTAVNGSAKADFSASVQYFFEIQAINGAPGTAPSLLPVLFGARGEGYSQADANSLSRSVGVADLWGAPLATWEARFIFELHQNQVGSFDDTKTLSLYPNYAYGVVIQAVCETWGPSASCTTSVGPSFLGFDQATFDATMGANTFPLNEYYKFVFSENLVNAIPIPPAVWLFGSGLLGLIGVARRRDINK